MALTLREWVAEPSKHDDDCWQFLGCGEANCSCPCTCGVTP